MNECVRIDEGGVKKAERLFGMDKGEFKTDKRRIKQGRKRKMRKGW